MGDRQYYLVRKTIAQAMLDIGMFTQHVKKLKEEMLNYDPNIKSYCTLIIGMIVLSLIFQATVGLLLAMNRHFERQDDGMGQAFTINDWLMTAVVCIICLNCFILCFDEYPGKRHST